MFLLRLPISLLLIIYQSAFLALGQIWANKVRSTLTTIGIVIGVASVTAVIAALTGLETSVLKQFESIGTNKLFVFPDRRGNYNVPYMRIRFRPEYFEGLLDHCPSVQDFTRVMDNRGINVSYGARTEQNAEVTGIDPAWHKIENRSVLEGRQFSLIDLERALPVCLVNQVAQTKLNLPVDCIGQTIVVDRARFVIIGIVEKSAEVPMFGDSGAA